jgi:hypothetical protein
MPSRSGSCRRAASAPFKIHELWYEATGSKVLGRLPRCAIVSCLRYQRTGPAFITRSPLAYRRAGVSRHFLEQHE